MSGREDERLVAVSLKSDEVDKLLGVKDRRQEGRKIFWKCEKPVQRMCGFEKLLGLELGQIIENLKN